MIRAEKKLTDIPTKPPADFSAMKRRNVRTFGTPTPELEALDRKRDGVFDKLKTQAAARIAERHMKRGGSLYCQMQPHKTPSWDEVATKRIDVLFDMEYKNVEGDDTDRSEVKKELRWCQGKVIKTVSVGDKEAEFEVEWDAMKDTEDFSEKTTSNVTLEADKFNKDTQDGWRLDFDFVALDVDFVDKKCPVKDGANRKTKEMEESDSDSDIES